MGELNKERGESRVKGESEEQQSGQIDSGDRPASSRTPAATARFFLSAFCFLCFFPTALHLHLQQACLAMSVSYIPGATLDDATWVAVLLVS